MIDSVRNTVLSVINKNNYGYISPADFNQFAKQAQLDIFEQYFQKYNNQINKENARMSGTGLAEITKQFEQFYRGELAGLAEWLQQDSNHARGEMVVMIEGASLDTGLDEQAIRWLDALKGQIQDKELAKIAAN